MQGQSDVLGYVSRLGHRFGMDIGVKSWGCGGIVPWQQVNEQVG